MSDPSTVTQAQWAAAIEQVVNDWTEMDAPPVPGTPPGTPRSKVKVHVTDPVQGWSPTRKSRGPVPKRLDVVPEGAATATENHTVPASMALTAIPHQARHAVVSARARFAQGIVAGTPTEESGVVAFPVILVLSSVPITPGTPVVLPSIPAPPVGR